VTDLSHEYACLFTYSSHLSEDLREINWNLNTISTWAAEIIIIITRRFTTRLTQLKNSHNFNFYIIIMTKNVEVGIQS